MLVWRDALIIVDFRSHVADGVGRLHVGHATPVNVLTKIYVQPREPFYVLLGTGRSHMAYACNNHGRVAGQGPSPRGQNESTPEQDAYDDEDDDYGNGISRRSRVVVRQAQH